MTPEQEPLAEALAIHRARGARGAVWIAARVGELALAGDIDRFRRIAAAYQRLVGSPVQ